MSDYRIELSPHLSKYEVADQLSREGYWREARAVERGECLPSHRAHEIEQVMDHELGLHPRHDFNLERCDCDEEDFDE